MELPAFEHSLHVSEPLPPDDGDHPLLALGDHDLPGLHSLLAQRHAVEVDVDPGAVARHLGERGGEAGGATVLQRLDQPSLDQLQRGLDQLLAGERVADLDGRTLRGGAFAELQGGACRPQPDRWRRGRVMQGQQRPDRLPAGSG